MNKVIRLFFLGSLICSNTYAQETTPILIQNSNGPVLGHSASSGVKILNIKGLYFKDLNKNGKLDPYEDWRLSVEIRAIDLAKRMSVEQIAGLMLYSAHQSIPASPTGFFAGSYNGKPFTESGADSWALTDQQITFLKNDHLRHVLITSVKSPEAAARWNNNIQALAEGLDLGIPTNNSSDPRHTANSTSEFNAGAGGQISNWPDGLAMAATFDPDLVEKFGHIAAIEYRALGISTALSPQIDLGTEPRWFRIANTFGESPSLVTDMARAYVDGFQTSYGKNEIRDGWGYQSVNAMVKHWPGGGPEEGGRDAHWAFGKYAVYPGNNFKTHLKPFTQGAFNLKKKTGKASALMPYYTISYNQDQKNGENVGNSYSKYLITDLLRDQYKYDGVVCTDWLITANEGKSPADFAGKPWGVEKLSIVERHYKAILAGVDQFGGNNDKRPVLEAYEMGVSAFGKTHMRQRFELSAIRLLKNIFRLGLFENPYLDIKSSIATVGNPEYMHAGFDAQKKSIILLKNKESVLPIKDKKTVFIPKIYTASSKDWFGNWHEATLDYPVNLDLVKKYYQVTDNPSLADFAIVFVTSPNSQDGGYDTADRNNSGNGYVPISLQYTSYQAIDGPENSIAAGDPVVDPTVKNRSYKNKITTVSNTLDLNTILNTKAMMQGKPVIVSVTASKPMIFKEFEKSVEGIVLNFGVSSQAVLDIISGKTEPSGLLPIQMPDDMKSVEKQREDVSFDIKCYVDTIGNIYDFGFGLNWSGQIKDDRTEKYTSK